MEQKIVTWADGYGTWHVSVPADTDSERRAKEAILDELRIRSHPNNMDFAYKHMTVTRERITSHGTVVYRETWPDDDTRDPTDNDDNENYRPSGMG